MRGDRPCEVLLLRHMLFVTSTAVNAQSLHAALSTSSSSRCNQAWDASELLSDHLIDAARCPTHGTEMTLELHHPDTIS